MTQQSAVQCQDVPLRSLVNNVAGEKLVQAVCIELNLLQTVLAERGVAHDF